MSTIFLKLIYFSCGFVLANIYSILGTMDTVNINFFLTILKFEHSVLCTLMPSSIKIKVDCYDIKIVND